MKKILFIATSADKMGDSDTGLWLEELATPYYLLAAGGMQIDIASPKGGKIPLDYRAFEPENITSSVEKFRQDALAMQKIENAKTLSTLVLQSYDAIFFPGGHGAVVDLPHDKYLQDNLGKYFETGRIVASICHGQGGLVGTVKSDGNSIVSGRNVTCFTNSEEVAIGADKKIPFLLETRIRELGGRFVCGADFTSFVVVDGNLITAQNPASSKECAEKLLTLLTK